MIPAGLLDKRVLITAAGSGIGRAMAEAFLRQGAKVAVCDIDAGSLDALASEAPEITAVAADVADEALREARRAGREGRSHDRGSRTCQRGEG